MTLPIPVGTLTQHVIALGRAAAITVPSAMDKAYAAGFFDGEGNICIASNKNGGARGNYLTYNMRVGASQKTPEAILWLRDRWGGSMQKLKIDTARDHYLWGCFSRDAAKFLTDVLQYLIVKRERAELALEFQRRTTESKFGRGGRPPDFKAWQASAKFRMNELNSPRTPA
jgi:hypothetical protein